MKKIFIFVIFIAFTTPFSGFANTWKESFYNNVRSYDYTIAVEKAFNDGVNVDQIASFSAELGFENIFTASVIYKTMENLMDQGVVSGDINSVLDRLGSAGISRSTIEIAKEMSLDDLEKGIGEGRIRIPGIVEIAMNYERYYGTGKKSSQEEGKESVVSNKDGNNKDQGLGFGDIPGLGFGNLVLSQFYFSFGGNISIFVSPSAP